MINIYNYLYLNAPVVLQLAAKRDAGGGGGGGGGDGGGGGSARAK